MKKYYQCSKCKRLLEKLFTKLNMKIVKKQGVKKKVLTPGYIESITCCNRRMRELSKEQYQSEKDRKSNV